MGKPAGGRAADRAARETARPGGRRVATEAALIYLVALALQTTFMAESAGNPFFDRQLSDSAQYLAWAKDMAAGRGFGPVAYFVNPLYLFFLTVLTKVSLGSVAAIRVVQAVLASAVYPLAYLAGSRLGGRRAGLLAAALLLGYGPLVQAGSELAGAWLEALLFLGAAVLLGGRRGPWRLAAAGLVSGLAALGRPTFLLFAVAAAALLALETPGGRRTGARQAGGALIYLACTALVVAPVTIRNLRAEGDPVLVSSHGGINFYLGNSPRSGGTFYAPEGFHEDLLSINHKDAKRLAEEAEGRALASSEVSRYWFRRGLAFLLHEPAAAARLYGRKLLLLVHSHEVSLNSDYYLFRRNSVVLRLLALPFAFILSASLAGMALAWKSGRGVAFLYLLAGTHLVSVLAFFISSRYRLPAVPVLAVFAGLAIDRAWSLAATAPRKVAAAGAAVAAAAVLLSLPYPLVRDLRLDSLASSLESLGIHYYETGDVAAAERTLRESVTVRPRIVSPHWYLARILERGGDWEGAEREWRLAAELYGPGSYWGQEAERNARRLQLRRPGKPQGPSASTAGSPAPSASP